ncbi:two-component regulator propeller domain-containing protein, partial [Maribacter sp.]|uniref:two-component regulator propeller domain-containing protein n=1 Tax=Maribacter sp. TaxID=1897614 RepID=UPI0025C3BB5F
MKTKKLHILYLFVFVWSFSFGQQYKNYSISDGLPSNHVYRITQDYNGFIWFITDKGMVKFDGEIFKTFTTQNGLPTNDIWDIKITKNNRVWYVSKSEKLGYIENDIVYSFPSSKKGEVFSSNNTGQTKDSVSFHSNYSYYVLEDSVFRKYPLKKRNFERVLAHPEIKNIEWGTKFRTLHFLDKNDSPVWSPTELQLTNSNTKTNGQLNDSIYYVSDNNKVVLLNFNQKKHFTINFKDALKYPTIKHQRLHNVNNETQITGSHFVGKLTCNHSISQIHYIPENIDSHFSFIDKTGNIWAASFNKGVYFFPASEKYTKTYFRNQKAQEIKKIDSTIWVTIFRKG